MTSSAACRSTVAKSLGVPETSVRSLALDVGGGWLIFDAPQADLGVTKTVDDATPAAGSDVTNAVVAHADQRHVQRAGNRRSKLGTVAAEPVGGEP